MQKLLVISIDSMVQEDLAILRKLPHLGPFCEESSVVAKMESTYPTLTHSIHTSILTGCRPGRHGIIANERFVPGDPHPPWYDRAEDVKAATLPELAQALGYRCGYVCYPLTVAASVPWVLHRANFRTAPADRPAVMRRLSTPGLYDKLQPAIGDCWEILEHFHASDRYSCAAAAQLYREFSPDILYVHLILVDHLRHQKGVFGPHLEEAYGFLDQEIGKLFSVLRELGLYDKMLINLTSDHGHLDVDRVISLNAFLKEHGLLQTSTEGSLSAYDAYAHSCALSAQVYIKDHDPELLQKTQSLLQTHKERLGISQILSKEQAAREYGLYGDFDLVVEGDGRTAFSSDCNIALCSEAGQEDYRYSAASHGHMPHKGPQPCFLLRYPGGAHRVSLAHGRVIDQAPTLAALLGFSMDGCDGTVIKELTEGMK